MSRIVPMQDGCVVADQTLVRPLLNPLDEASGLRPGILDEFSMAIGELEPGQYSKIHVHPVVTLVTVVLTGTLEFTIKDPKPDTAFTGQATAISAVLVERGAFVQWHNAASDLCRVLYVVGPPYVARLAPDGRVLYEDAVTLQQDWDALAELAWAPPELPDVETHRAARRAAELAVRGSATP